MSGEKISQMPNIGTLNGEELVPVVRGGVVENFTTTTAQIAALAASGAYISVTESQALTASQSGSVIDNYGASQTITLILPAWRLGLVFTFTVAADQALIIDPDGSDQISVNGELYGDVNSQQLYASLILATSNLPGVWITRSLTGEWGS